MANYTDIAALSDEVLASVRETSVKTASSADVTSALKSDIGQSLKLAAAAVRNLRDDQVTEADVAAVIAQARKYAAADKTAFWPFTSAPGKPQTAAASKPVFGGYATEDDYANAYYNGIAHASHNKLPGFTLTHPDGTSDEYDSDGTLKSLTANKTAGHRRVIRSAGLSTQLRKIAADVRAHGQTADMTRAVKTAKVIAAAVGIEHLAKTLKA